jgi:hypothetical protein
LLVFFFGGAQGQSDGRLFYFTNYGADPTGAMDNTQALLEAINEAFQVTTTRHTMPGLHDLGASRFISEEIIASTSLFVCQKEGAAMLW